MQSSGEKTLKANNLEEPHPIDIYVGERIRYFREFKGITQHRLGERIGVRFQQVQKYESGANRISASRLFLICEAFDITLTEFFGRLYKQKGRRAANASPRQKKAILPPAFFKMKMEKRRKFIDVMGQIAELAAPNNYPEISSKNKPEYKVRGKLYNSMQDIADEEGLSRERIRQKMIDPAYPDYICSNILKGEPPPSKYLVRGQPYRTMQEIADAEGTDMMRIRQKIIDPSCTEYQRLYKRRT